ncbi:unnamed protein product [Rhizophagus irregularis]|nr:unnamed protein product [Rhizophagus irregularis]
MTLPYLTDDCIYYILQYLQNDDSTLFNCLLVNRFWCKSTIPLIYANPFAKKSKKKYLIISTLIFCFNKAEILQLKNQLTINQINNINIDEEHKPLFEYPKYLEDYHDFEINSTIIRYCSGLLISNNKMYDDIIPIFHQSILRQSRNIKQLNISSYLFYKESFKNFNVQNFVSNLTRLNSFSFYLIDTINNEIENEFLRNIADISLNLRKLLIKLPQRSYRHDTSNNLINTTTWEKLHKIIQGQNKLKIFKIKNCYSLLNNVLLSLEFQKHSLVHIEFINTDFINVDLKSFNSLYNLEYLMFESCKGILLNQCEILNCASFKLKTISFKCNIWKVDVTSLIIKYLGASIQRLFVENPTINLIEDISMYCPNLTFLKLRIHFLIDLISLANNIPINISKISISIYYPYSSIKFLKFREFLENCHDSFEMINLNHIIELRFLKIVLNYIERSNNSLKILGMMNLDKELCDEELKLLNQIKAKGVKIVEFNSIHDVYKGL